LTEFNLKAKFEPDIQFTVSYAEAKAIHFISTYGQTAFMKALGEYIPSKTFEGNEAGLRSFIKKMKSLSSALEQVEAAHKVINGPYELVNTVRQWQAPEEKYRATAGY
jgi:hypothetical protein